MLLSWINVYIRLKPTPEAFAALVTEMSQRNQPEGVRTSCIVLLAKQSEAGLTFDPSKIAQSLLFDFNYAVRKTLA